MIEMNEGKERKIKWKGEGWILGDSKDEVTGKGLEHPQHNIRMPLVGPKNFQVPQIVTPALRNLTLARSPEPTAVSFRVPNFLSFSYFLLFFKILFKQLKKEVVCYVMGPWQIFLLSDLN